MALGSSNGDYLSSEMTWLKSISLRKTHITSQSRKLSLTTIFFHQLQILSSVLTFLSHLVSADSIWLAVFSFEMFSDIWDGVFLNCVMLFHTLRYIDWASDKCPQHILVIVKGKYPTVCKLCRWNISFPTLRKEQHRVIGIFSLPS